MDAPGPASPAWQGAFGHDYDFVNDADSILQERCKTRKLQRRQSSEAAEAAAMIRDIQTTPLDDLLWVSPPSAWTGYDGDLDVPPRCKQPMCAFPAPQMDASFTAEHKALAFRLVKIASAEMKVASEGLTSGLRPFYTQTEMAILRSPHNISLVEGLCS